MKTSFKSVQPRILALVGAAGVLPALAPATSQAQNNTYYGLGALQSGSITGAYDSAFGCRALEENTTGVGNTATADQVKIFAQQQQEINSLTASLKEQASLLQKVSAQMQVMRSAPQVVSNNN